MAYKGQNSIAQSVQIWNGTSWVPLNGLLFSDTQSAIANTLWKGPGGELGYTGPTLEGKTAVLDNQSVATAAQVTERRLRVFLDCPAGTDPTVNYDLPIAMYGRSPIDGVPSEDTNTLIAEVTVGFNVTAGSEWDTEKWLVRWQWGGTGFDLAKVQLLSGGNSDLTLVASGDGGSPDEAPRLTFGLSGTVVASRMFAKIDLSLIVMNGSP